MVAAFVFYGIQPYFGFNSHFFNWQQLLSILSRMLNFKFFVSTILSVVVCFHAFAQGDAAKSQDDNKRKAWVNANMNSKQDAIDFIKTVYKDFTVLINKRSLDSGIYNREVKFNDCELIIETDIRRQESSWKSDSEFVKDIVIMELDKVILDGDDIKPNGPDNTKGLFAGKSYAHFHKIPSYSILAAAPNRDNDKFSDLHYEQHLQWAYQYLIEKCTAQNK